MFICFVFYWLEIETSVSGFESVAHFMETGVLKHGTDAGFNMFVLIVDGTRVFLRTGFHAHHTDVVVKSAVNSGHYILQHEPVHFSWFYGKASRRTFYRANDALAHQELEDL